MQTFLPYEDFALCAQSLDYRRLGKQRVEARQIYDIVKPDGRTTGGWINHPAVNMWRHYSVHLSLYYNEILDEWIRRGYRNNMQHIRVRGLWGDYSLTRPWWLGNSEFHDMHKALLIRKDPVYYRSLWPDVDDTQVFTFPTESFGISA